MMHKRRKFCLYNSHPMNILAQPSKTRVFFAQDLPRSIELAKSKYMRCEASISSCLLVNCRDARPFGSGKSTLLNILGGLDVPTAGIVHYADHDLTAADDVGLTRFRREHVGFVFQFYNLIPSLTALENVSLITEISKNPMPRKMRCDWSDSKIAKITFHRNSLEANNNAWRLPAPSPNVPMSSCATSRPALDVATERLCWKLYCGSTRNAAH